MVPRNMRYLALHANSPPLLAQGALPSKQIWGRRLLYGHKFADDAEDVIPNSPSRATAVSHIRFGQQVNRVGLICPGTGVPWSLAVACLARSFTTRQASCNSTLQASPGWRSLALDTLGSRHESSRNVLYIVSLSRPPNWANQPSELVRICG